MNRPFCELSHKSTFPMAEVNCCRKHGKTNPNGDDPNEKSVEDAKAKLSASRHQPPEPDQAKPNNPYYRN